MAKKPYKYKYKRKDIVIPIQIEEFTTPLYHCLNVEYNISTNTIHIYSRFRFKGRYITCFSICRSIAKTKYTDNLRNEIKEIMKQNPSISSYKLSEVTGYSITTICRYYMALKREI